MEKNKHGFFRHHKDVDPDNIDRGRIPYWKRAHHDWRFWVGLTLMLAAMAVYVASDDLSLIPHRPSRTGQTSSAGNTAR